MERTFIIIKPDAVGRGLVGRILQRFEDKGLRIVALKILRISMALARKHYAEHKNKPFYPGLLRFIAAGPSVAAVIEGKNAVEVCRRMLGVTAGWRAEPGTIRGDFGVSDRYNLVHASDSRRSAKREIALYFRPAEMVKYSRNDMRWIYDLNEKKPL